MYHMPEAQDVINRAEPMSFTELPAKALHLSWTGQWKKKLTLVNGNTPIASLSWLVREGEPDRRRKEREKETERGERERDRDQGKE